MDLVRIWLGILFLIPLHAAIFAVRLQRPLGKGVCRVCGSGEQKKESPGVKEHGQQPARSPLALFLTFF
eukprot:784161-Pelagomonas_calceolata.AAC.3